MTSFRRVSKVLAFQPVIPVSLNGDWNLVFRTIVPVVSQNNISPGSGSQTGLTDVVQSFFFSPTKPSAASPDSDPHG